MVNKKMGSRRGAEPGEEISKIIDRSTLELLPVIIAVHDARREVLWANRSYREATGATLEETAGRKCYTLWGRSLPCEGCPVQKTLETGEAAEAEITPFNQKHWSAEQGAWIVRAEPVKDRQGRLIGVLEVVVEITKRWQAEEELRSAGRLLRAQAETSPYGVVAADAEDKVIFWNRRICDLFDIPDDVVVAGKEEGYLQWAAERVVDPEEFVNRVLELYADQQARGRDEIDLKDGRTLERYSSPLIDEEGLHRGRIWYYHDITERKKAETVLRQSEEKFRALVEQASEMLFLHDLEGHIRDVNEEAVRTTGYSRQELLGMKINDLDLEADIRQDKRRLWSGMEPRGDPVVIASRHRRKDGSFYPTEVSISKVTLVDGEYILALARNITERRKAEEELEKQRKMLTRTELIAGMGSWEWDFEKDRVTWSNGVFNIFGMDPAGGAPRFRDQTRIYLPEDMQRLWAAVEACRDQGVPYRIEARAIKRGGDIIYCLIEGQVERDARGRIHRLVGTVRDITRRKQAEAEQERLQAQLIQAQRMESIGRLAGGIAHDYNNMLSVILGNTELAIEQLSPDRPAYSNLEQIAKAAERSRDITRQLLAFARRQTISPEVLHINEIIPGTIKMMKHLIGEDISIEWIPGDQLWSVMMDRSQLDQILANLCVNARDAIEGIGTIKIETGNIRSEESYSLENPDLGPGEYVRLRVSDNGTGMDQETMKRVFEPFFTTKEVTRGTGLGLATVYGIVNQNRGGINVASTPGRGTTFSIYLPRHRKEGLSESVKMEEDLIQGSGETVLLVEDEEPIMEMGRTMLEQLGYKVLTAVTPEEALRLARKWKDGIDLLLTDVVMPGMNGRDLVNQITKFSPAVKIMFMSGYTADVIADRGVLGEGISFLQKPFSRMELGRKVRMVLNSP